jgi:phosphoribosylanthranilate isomerase
MSVEVKICGLTNRDDALAALEHGADYLGFVLYARSPRSVTPSTLSAIREDLPAECRVVGVFVNHTRQDVERIAGDCGLFAAQIHGDEEAAAFEAMAVTLWRAVRLEDGVWKPTPGQWPAARYVVDATAQGRYGGTGTKADWDAAGLLAAERPVMLAGGLTADNVAEAVQAVHPLGVDVSSGVESAPGRKDHAKMRLFIRAAKGR